MCNWLLPVIYSCLAMALETLNCAIVILTEFPLPCFPALFAVCGFTQIKMGVPHICMDYFLFKSTKKILILRSSPRNIIFQMISSLLHWVAKPVYPSSSATYGTNFFQFERDKLWELSAQMINDFFACFPSKDCMICPVK